VFDISTQVVGFVLLTVTNIKAARISPVMKNGREWGIVSESEIKASCGGNTGASQ